MPFTLVATAKNEGPYFLEWVAHHRMIGFDTILLYQNDSDDLTHEILRTLDRIGAVHYFYNRAGRGRHQVKAYKRAARHQLFRDADFAMALDLDEFLCIHTGDGTLSDLLKALPETDKVLINWRRFGNGGQTRIEDDLVTERFVRAEAADRVTTHLTPYKALFRPSHYHRCGIHQPREPLVDEDSIRVCNGSGLVQGAFDQHRFRAKDPEMRRLAQINHYITRDAASFVLKSARGSAHQADRGVNQTYWQRRNFNDEEDARLADRAPALRAAMDALDEKSGGRLGRLRRKALERHRERFRAVLEQPEGQELYAFCTKDAAA